MENGDCSKKKLLCCSFPFMLSSTLMWDSSHRRWSFAERHPFHRLQFSKACSNVGSCNGLQSFGNRLLQCGFSTGSQVLPEKHAQAPVHEHGPCRGLLWHGVSLGCIFPGDMSIYCSVRSSMGCRVISAPTWSSPRTAWGKPAPVYAFAWAALCSSTWSTSSPCFSDGGLCRIVSNLFIIPLSHSCWVAFFCLFWNMFYSKQHHLGWGAQLCSVVSLLDPSGSSCI